MNNRINICIFLMLLSFELLSSDAITPIHCGKISYSFSQKFKTVEKVEKLCIAEQKKKNNVFLISPQCISGQCEVLPEFPRFIELHNSNYGTPEFELCEKLKGNPQRIQYQFNKKKRLTAICRFNNGVIVGLPYLMNRWKDHVSYK